jgi:prepilin signal peptidase PulO-like enzyme (type II secretory pathway)
LFAPFYILWRASDGRWIGLGDADLAACIGFYLGLMAGFGAVVLAFGVGALYATGVLLGAAFGKKYRREVPFAPFLLIGFIIAYAAVNIPSVGTVAEQALSSFFLL